MALTQVSSDGIKNLNVKTADLENSGVTAGTYGSASLIPALVIDAKGRVTSASTNSISTDLVNDSSPQLGGDLQSNGHDIDFADNDKAIFGTGNDLEIYHNGSHNFINITNGQLRIRHGTDNAIKTIADGAVQLYYDGSNRLLTTTGGIEIIGETVASSHIQLADNARLKLGTGQDIQIYHDGSNSYLDNTTGNFEIRSNEFRVKSYDSTEPMIHATKDAEVRLYHNNFKCITTDTNGIIINGPEGDYAGIFINADEGDDDADKWFIKALQTGSTLQILSRPSGSWKTSIECNGDGNVELYHDNIKTFETISGGAKLQGGEGLAAHLYMFADEGDDNADKWVFRADASSSQLKLRNYAGGSWEESIIANGNGAVELYYDNSKKLETESSGARTYGDHNVTGEIHLTTDNQSLKIGAGADLRIKHDGTHNYVNFVNGALIFQNNGTGVAYFHDSDGHFLPWTNNTFDLGNSSNRWRNVYTNDLNLSNEGGANDIDGTWGSFTIQEGAKDLFLINKRNGKKYKFNLTEVL